VDVSVWNCDVSGSLQCWSRFARLEGGRVAWTAEEGQWSRRMQVKVSIACEHWGKIVVLALLGLLAGTN
jgi:hypothetical protein